MNDNNAFERFIADHLADDGSGTARADRLAALIHERSSERRQSPRWLALIKEPPMRTNNHLAVGSSTARVAAIAVATLLLALTLATAGAGVQRLLAADGAIIVAQDGSGDYVSIQEAVDAAADGGEIQVRPGTYVEAVTIDKDITLSGDGDRAKIVLTAPEDGPVAPAGSWTVMPAPDNPYAILVVGSDAEIAGLTLRGERSALQVQGGAPVLRDLSFEAVGRPFAGAIRADASVVLSGGTTAELRESVFDGGGVVRVFDRSDVVIAENELRGGPYLQGAFGPGALVVENEVTDSARNCVTITDPTTARFERNRCLISEIEEAFFFTGAGEGYDPVIRENVIEGALVGVDVPSGGRPVIDGNEFIGNQLAIDLPVTDATVVGNVVRDGTNGIFVWGGRSPEIRDNTIVDNAGRGVWIRSGTTPSLIGNEVCGNAEDVVVEDDAEPDMSDNEICAAASAE